MHVVDREAFDRPPFEHPGQPMACALGLVCREHGERTGPGPDEDLAEQVAARATVRDPLVQRLHHLAEVSEHELGPEQEEHHHVALEHELGGLVLHARGQADREPVAVGVPPLVRGDQHLHGVEERPGVGRTDPVRERSAPRHDLVGAPRAGDPSRRRKRGLAHQRAKNPRPVAVTEREQRTTDLEVGGLADGDHAHPGGGGQAGVDL